jgi:hypothetical protein
MFEVDPFTVATLAHNTVDVVANVLGELGQSVGGAMDGSCETVSGMTPGGDEMPAGAGEAAGDAAGQAAETAGEQGSA